MRIRPHTLVTIGTFDSRIIAWLGAVTAEMTSLVTITTDNVVWVAWLFAFFGHVTFFTAITAGTRAPGWAVFGEVANCDWSEEH